MKSADPSGLRVERPPFFEPLFFPTLLFLTLRTSFLSEPLILLSLRAQGDVCLPPSPLLGLGSAGLDWSGTSPRSCCFRCFRFGGPTFRKSKITKKYPFPRRVQNLKNLTRCPQETDSGRFGDILWHQLSLYFTIIKNLYFATTIMRRKLF